MPKIVSITPTFAVASALAPEDFAEVARLGFRAVVNNRPDGEEAGQLPARQAAQVARAAGLGYRHVPAAKLELFDDRVVDAMAAALAAADGPVLAHCKSGQRAAIVWAAARVRCGEDLDEVLGTLSGAGFDLEVVRDELEAVGRDGRVDRPCASDAVASTAV